jgi:opacity protein-like surface antigen
MKIAFFSATVLASSLATAATPIDGLYSSVFGGYSYLPDNVSERHHGIKFERASFNNGYNAGYRFGYQTHPLRYEGEFSYLRANVKSFHSNRFPFGLTPGFKRHRNVSGNTSAVLGMGNLYYDFPDMVPCIAPFLGLGLGYGWIETSMGNHSRFTRRHFKGSGSSFAYQGTAGLTYNFTENYALNIAYRYVGTTQVNGLGKVFQGHLASVGVIYRFNEYNYK